MLPPLLLLTATLLATESPPAACPDTEAAYTRAVDALAHGLAAEALVLLEQVQARCPSHPHAAELARVAQRAVELRAGRAGGRRPAGAEGVAALASVELAGFQALHGLVQGVALSSVTRTWGGQAVFGLLGAVGGAAASTLLTLGGLTHGQALTLNSATAWTVWMLGASTAAFFPQATGSLEVLALFQLTTLAATLGGGALAFALSPPVGRVSLMNSGGLWSAVVAGLFLHAGGVMGSRTGWGLVLGASVLGGAGGLLLGQWLPMSRGRALLIDLGGGLGLLLGWGLAALLSRPARASPFVPGLAMASTTVCGLALATVLSRGMDAPRLPPVSLAPLGPDGGPGLGASLAF